MMIYSAVMAAFNFAVAFGIVRSEIISRKTRSEIKSKFRISVIIPARNEAENLPLLFESLEKIMTPDIEIILADDRSEDTTLALMQGFASSHENVKVIVNRDPPSKEMNPKQNVLAIAEKHASGDLFFFTDADCTVPEKWITAVSRFFEESRTGIVLSPVVTRPGKSFAERYQTFDHFLRFYYTVGASGLGTPSGGFGNNLAIRREALRDVGNFEGIGFSLTEDAQLIASVSNTKKWKISVCTDSSATVYARPKKRIKDVLRQEIRWSAGALFGKDKAVRFLYAFMLLLTLLGTLSAPFIFFFPSCSLCYFTSVFVMILISLTGSLFSKPGRDFLLWILPCSFIGTFFYGITFLSAFFVHSVKWKGMKISK